LRLGDGFSGLEQLPGVQAVTDFGQFQELRLSAGADPQPVLTTLAKQNRVLHFEVARPSLHDIFVRIARPQDEVNGHA
jgi:ABC-2 type transport system ATP-binding protein